MATKVDPSLRGKETVLVVSDASEMLRIVAKTLRGLGYHVLEASSALKAQNLAGTEPKIDLLLADLSMSQTNLLDVAAWFRAIYPETKVLVTMGSMWEMDTQLAVLREVSLLAKPFTAPELASMVRRILD